jgi:DNA mismatch repair ATPase MutS
MADEWPDRATNMHLSDRIEEQALVFDYKLRPGVVSKSNAIELMRSIGLPV